MRKTARGKLLRHAAHCYALAGICQAQARVGKPSGRRFGHHVMEKANLRIQIAIDRSLS
jgi:hypothetical protein